MRFDDPALQSALEAWRRDPEIRERACADNAHFEERVSDARRKAFETLVATAPRVPATLSNQHDWYWRKFVKADETIPHTFLPEFDPARLGPETLEPFQPIVRLEDIRSPLGQQGYTLAELQTALTDPQSGLIERFLEDWNGARDWRPAFAAWEDQLLDEIDAPDWADRLRDRMGLAHYDPTDKPIPVVLMRYTVAQVQTEADHLGLHQAFVAPTVLDTGPWPYFFPAPATLPYGRAMPLTLSDDDNKQLLAEMLHIRLPYRRAHIVKFGEIQRRTGTPDLKALRNNHLTNLQLASDRFDFGEEIA